MPAPDLSGLKLLARGRTAEVFEWTDGHVLKLFLPEYSGVTADMEINVNRQLVPLDLPIPKLVDVVQVDQRRGIVFERVDGELLAMRFGRQPWRVLQLARQFAALHAKIHRYELPELTPFKQALKYAIQRVDLLTDSEKQRVFTALEALPDGETLCHCDYHPEQVLLGENTAYVVDWLNACKASPAADVARTLLILRVGTPPHQNPVMHRIVQAFIRVFEWEYWRRYVSLNPAVNRHDVDAWLLPVTAARLAEGIEHERETLLKFVRERLEQL